MPEIYNILEGHCERLGMNYVPDLYLTDRAIHAPIQAFSTWKHDFIVITRAFLERKQDKILDVLAFVRYPIASGTEDRYLVTDSLFILIGPYIQEQHTLGKTH